MHGTILYFNYDTDGNVTSFTHYNDIYYYVKNLQGDVVKIIDRNGNAVVTYTYDVWGNIIKQTDSTNYNLANVNPYKYRGYVYDYETGLYYLNSRYYDPVTGRFINADSFCDTKTGSPLSTNMFTYCGNNFLNYIDNSGHSGNEIWVSPKTCPVEKRAVQLGLIYKSELKEFYYCGMYYGTDGYEHYTYN